VEKCIFEQPKVKYLGLILSEGRVEMDLVMVTCIQDWPTPRNVTEVQSFIGFVNFYWCFVQDFSHVAKPSTSSPRKERSGGGQKKSNDPLKSSRGL